MCTLFFGRHIGGPRRSCLLRHFPAWASTASLLQSLTENTNMAQCIINPFQSSILFVGNVSSLPKRLISNYYQYARPNDKLPSVNAPKDAPFCGQMGRVRAENKFAALMLTACRDVKQLCSTNEIPRIPFQCQSWRELLWMSFVALQWTFDVWRLYFKMEEVPNF